MTRKEFIEYANEFGFNEAVLELNIVSTWSYNGLLEEVKDYIDMDYLAEALSMLEQLIEIGDYGNILFYDGGDIKPLVSIEDVEDYFDDDIDDEEMPIEWTKPIHETEDDYYGGGI